MIDYFKGIYGINLLARIHGSALYKGSLVGLVAVLVYLAIVYQWNENSRDGGNYEKYDEDGDLGHPYAAGVLVSSVSFLIIFRANYGYLRYWEACGAVQAMMSKLMDATQYTYVFYLQNKNWDQVRPPSFFDHDDLNAKRITRNRKRLPGEANERRLSSIYDCRKERDTIAEDDSARRGNFFRSFSEVTGTGGLMRFSSNASNAALSGLDDSPASVQGVEASPGRRFGRSKSDADVDSIGAEGTPGMFRRFGRSPLPPLPDSRQDAHWDIIPPTPDTASNDILRRAALNSKYFPASQLPNQNFATQPDGRTPPLFLQELAHLSSLASAVALSTLRNDIEYSESPLDMFVPGSPWPPADPDKLPKHIRRDFQHRFRPITILRHWMGTDRHPQWRSKYNVSRPLHVIGGVSDAEIQFLQMAKGPHAKAQIAVGWCLEIMTREHLEGGLGEVHSAIISRLVQFWSDALLHYNTARMIMYIPFPFPHAQLSAFFTVLMVVVVPFLLDQFTNGVWMGCLITFLTVTCLVGLHEVARELENPFRNVPNEIPLCTLQAMYNEALVVMFSGYNPDSFWDAEAYQGVMEASVMSKIYQKHGNKTTSSGFVDENGYLEMSLAEETRQPTRSASDSSTSSQKATMSTQTPVVPAAAAAEGQTAEVSSPSKRVTFVSNAKTGGGATVQLRETLTKQALEIAELQKALDIDGENRQQDGGVMGSLSSTMKSSFPAGT